MATGWIKISRDIQTHWIYQDAEKLKWWLDLLLLANYEDKEFNIKFKVFQCKRGQLLYSLKSLSQRWNVSKSVVNNFLEMLRKQNMIETENETVTTRITICNYDTYQQKENANETQIKRKRNANKTECDTTKEYKEEEEEQETINKTNTIFSFDEFWETYNKKTGRVDCERIYARLKDKDYAKIKETLPIYLERLKEKDKQYQKNPKTYLNGRYWEDEIYQEEAKTTEPTPSVPYEGFNPLSIDLSKLKPLQ